MAHPFIPFTNVAKVQMIFSQYGQRIQNGFYFRNTAGAFDVVQQATLANALVAWWSTNLKSLVTVDCSLVQIDVKDMTSQYAPGINFTTGLPLAGTANTEGSPTNVTIAVKFTTGLSGRSFRGRVYHIGLPSSVWTADQVDSSHFASMMTAYRNLVTSPPTDWQMVIASQYNSGAWRTTGVATDVIAAGGDSYLDSQRRRLIGRGR